MWNDGIDQEIESSVTKKTWKYYHKYGRILISHHYGLLMSSAWLHFRNRGSVTPNLICCRMLPPPHRLPILWACHFSEFLQTLSCLYECLSDWGHLSGLWKVAWRPELDMGDQNCGGFNTPGNSPQPMTLVSLCINTPAPSPLVWDDVEPCVLLVSPQDQPIVVAGILEDPLLKGAFSLLYTFLLPLLGSLCSQINNLLSDPWFIVSGGIQMNQVSCMSPCFLSQSVKTRPIGVMYEVSPAYWH